MRQMKSFGGLLAFFVGISSPFYHGCEISTESGASEQLQVSPQPFNDISATVYRQEILEASNLGIVSGFGEGQFRPFQPLTREQGVSILSEILSRVSQTQSRYSYSPLSEETVDRFLVDLSGEVPTPGGEEFGGGATPLSDGVGRWSYPKVLTANLMGLISGFPDGSFRPQDKLKRSEYMAMLARAVRHVRAALGKSLDLSRLGDSFAFQDTAGHWSQKVVADMSRFCRVASPVNEVGQSFKPEDFVLRDYAAAASVRFLKCIAQGADLQPSGAFSRDELNSLKELVVVHQSGAACSFDGLGAETYPAGSILKVQSIIQVNGENRILVSPPQIEGQTSGQPRIVTESEPCHIAADKTRVHPL